MSNHTPLKTSSNESVSKNMVIAGISFGIFAFGILGFLAWTLSTIQTQNTYLADRIDTYTSSNNSGNGQGVGGQVAGAQVTPALPAEAEIARKKIESIISIPLTGDIPNFSAIDDMSKVANEPFFVRAQVKDHLFVYPKSKIAILYRPSSQKVINMADINPGQQGSSSETPQGRGQTPSQPGENETVANNPKQIVKIVSAGADEAAIELAKDFITKNTDLEISPEDVAKVAGSLVSKNRVVNISNTPNIQDTLMKEFEAEEGPLPDGLNADGADVVLILTKE